MVIVDIDRKAGKRTIVSAEPSPDDVDINDILASELLKMILQQRAAEMGGEKID